MTDGDVIDVAHVDPAAAPPRPPAPVTVRDGRVVGPAAASEPQPPGGDVSWSRLLAIATLQAFQDEAEKLYLVAKLAESGGNVTRTAEAIDTPRSNLYKKIDRYGLKRERSEAEEKAAEKKEESGPA
jgi:two-component system nitrogen regulation response regulator NtrX